MMANQQMQDMVLEHVAAEDARDSARVLATYSREAPVFEDVATGVRCDGAPEVLAEYRSVWDGFPELRRRITRWTIDEDSVVIEVTISGRHDGPFRGLPPTGKAVELRGIAHFQFDAEGRIKHETVYYDALTLLRQLGVDATM